MWYNVSGGGVDPSLPGKTGIQVNIITNDSANSVATKTVDAIGAQQPGLALLSFDPNFLVSSKFLIELNEAGATLSSAGAGTSGFTVVIVQTGQNNVLGQPNRNDSDTWRDTFLEVAITC